MKVKNNSLVFNSLKNLFRRDGILKSFGYDTGMVWINTDLDTALERAAKRDRSVPPEFIKSVFENLSKNKNYYKKHFKFFTEINNSDGELTDSVVNKAYISCQNFFLSKIENPVGEDCREKLINSNGELIPTIYSDLSSILNSLNGWYGNY